MQFPNFVQFLPQAKELIYFVVQTTMPFTKPLHSSTNPFYFDFKNYTITTKPAMKPKMEVKYEHRMDSSLHSLIIRRKSVNIKWKEKKSSLLLGLLPEVLKNLIGIPCFETSRRWERVNSPLLNVEIRERANVLQTRHNCPDVLGSTTGKSCRDHLSYWTRLTKQPIRTHFNLSASRVQFYTNPL